MPAFLCPKCEKGSMDSGAGEETSCWYCSQFFVCYVCRGTDSCGTKLCQTCLAKVLAQKQKPKQPLKFKPGEIGNGG